VEAGLLNQASLGLKEDKMDGYGEVLALAPGTDGDLSSVSW